MVAKIFARRGKVELMAECCRFSGMGPDELFGFLKEESLQALKDHIILMKTSKAPK